MHCNVNTKIISQNTKNKTTIFDFAALLEENVTTYGSMAFRCDMFWRPACCLSENKVGEIKMNEHYTR